MKSCIFDFCVDFDHTTPKPSFCLFVFSHSEVEMVRFIALLRNVRALEHQGDILLHCFFTAL